LLIWLLFSGFCKTILRFSLQNALKNVNQFPRHFVELWARKRAAAAARAKAAVKIPLERLYGPVLVGA